MASLYSLCYMARLLGVGQSWLREQAKAGKVPCLQVGERRYLFNAPVVEAAVAMMAARPLTADEPERQGDSGNDADKGRARVAAGH